MHAWQQESSQALIRPGFSAISETSCSKEMFSTGFPVEESRESSRMILQRVTQPCCSCLQERGPSPLLCHGPMGLPRFWGHQLHTLVFAASASPQFGGWQTTGSSQHLPLLMVPALPFTKTSQQGHITTSFCPQCSAPVHPT